MKAASAFAAAESRFELGEEEIEPESGAGAVQRVQRASGRQAGVGSRAGLAQAPPAGTASTSPPTTPSSSSSVVPASLAAVALLALVGSRAHAGGSASGGGARVQQSEYNPVPGI